MVDDLELSCGCGFLWSQFETSFNLDDIRYCVCCGEKLDLTWRLLNDE